MRTINKTFRQMIADVPAEVKTEADLSFAIANRLDAFIRERGLSKNEFAEAIGKRPGEVTKWLSGQHNSTIRTLSMLSAFFGKSLISPIT